MNRCLTGWLMKGIDAHRKPNRGIVGILEAERKELDIGLELQTLPEDLAYVAHTEHDARLSTVPVIDHVVVFQVLYSCDLDLVTAVPYVDE